MNSARSVTIDALLIAALLGGGLAAPATQAQQAAPALAPIDPASEAAALQRLSEQLQTRRSELDVRREALRDERARLSAVDRPASAEQIAQWRDRHAAATYVRRRVTMLEGLLAALTPQALDAISPPTEMKYEFLTTDVGLKSTSMEVNLHDAPDGEATLVLPADTLIVRLAVDSDGLWSVVVAANGSGFVPTSMLKRAD